MFWYISSYFYFFHLSSVFTGAMNKIYNATYHTMFTFCPKNVCFWVTPNGNQLPCCPVLSCPAIAIAMILMKIIQYLPFVFYHQSAILPTSFPHSPFPFPLSYSPSLSLSFWSRKAMKPTRVIVTSCRID